MKKIILITTITAMAIFTFTIVSIKIYRSGIQHGADTALHTMHNYQSLFISARAANIIDEIHQFKSNHTISKIAICDLRKIALKNEDDWNNCKKNDYCKNKTKSGFFLKIDEKIDDFKKIECTH